MSVRGKWLHAGVRADPTARDATRAQGRRGSFARMGAEQEAKDLWRRGYVRPWLISTALNFADLYGPDADAAVGVEEPALDRWEDGSLYPTWEDLKRLAAATHFPVSFFTRLTVEPMSILDTTLRFHMPARRVVQIAAAERKQPDHYSPDVIQATVARII